MSRHFPPILMVLAPLAVVIPLGVFQNLAATFFLYPIVACLALPMVDSVWVRRVGLRGHLRRIGLAGSGIRSGNRSGVVLGLGLGVFCGAAIVFGVERWPWLISGLGTAGDAGGVSHDALTGQLAAWSITPGNARSVLLFMVLIDAFAEETFWRGYLHERFQHWPRRSVAILVTAIGYTSYHALTLFSLIEDRVLAGGLVLLVLAAGAFLGWLRERWGSVWPPFLVHQGIVVGYMVVFWGVVGPRG